MKCLWRCLLLMSVVVAAVVDAQTVTPTFNPLTFKQGIDGKPHQVLVLGSVHLREMKTLDLGMLELLLQRLQAYQPQIITIESLSGLECDLLKRHAATFQDTWDGYCSDTAAAQKATGLDVPQARAEVEKLLASLPAAPTPAQRRQLAAMFLAADERASASVQWRKLPASERKAEDGIDTALLEALEARMTTRNESYAIAAAVAARVGLERVYATDDHTADGGLYTALAREPREKEYLEFMKQHFGSGSKVLYKELESKQQAAESSTAAMLDLYRFINSPRVSSGLIEADFRRAIQTPSPQNYGRLYMAWWETRNLRMVANIRQVMGTQPGARVLAVVGGSHKAYFDAYLNLMHDVQLVNAETVLK